MKYRINYGKVIAQANAIAENASELSTQIQILGQIEQNCRAAWKGEASDAFLKKLSTLRAEMSRTKNEISELAATIKYCADRIQREDEEAAARASALNSGH